MRSHKTYSKTMRWRYHLLLAALVVIAVMGCMFNPAAAETSQDEIILSLTSEHSFPTETTRLVRVDLLFDDWLRAIWENDEHVHSITMGAKINKIRVIVQVDLDYVPHPTVRTKCRVHATITAADGTVVFNGFLPEIYGWGDKNGSREIQLSQQFPEYLLARDNYTVITVYEVLIGDTWTHIETWTNHLSAVTRPVIPDVPTDYETWLPIMLSFAMIGGMAFIGFNFSRGGDDSPAPVLFMIFSGVMFTWAIDWLPTWIFIMSIALLSIASAKLWGKAFKGR